MAAQQKKSILAGMYGAGGDLAKEIAADTSLPSAGFQDPPPGIRNGKAQLDSVTVKLWQTGKNEGKPYFEFIGNICEPLEHSYTPTSQGQATGDPTTVTTAGMRTRITIDVFDKKAESGKNMGKVTPWQDGAKQAAQHMRALGADTSKVRTLADLETLAETLTRVARNPNTPIYFNFATSVRKAQNVGDADGVWQNWNGTAGLENYTPPDGTQAVNDASPDAGTGDTGMGDNIDASEGGTAGDLTELDLETLAEQAKGEEGQNETPAIDELLRRASEVSGRTVDDIEGAVNSVDDVVAIINGGDAGASDEPAPKEPPKKGEKVNYRVPVKKMGKLVPGKPVECNVESVNTAKGTATLKNMVDGKTIYKDVPLSELEDIS